MNKKILISGIVATLVYIGLSFALKNSAAIWINTRIFGLFAFLTLFITVSLGEIRLLFKVKGDFSLFRFHKPIAIFSTYLVLLHFISAVFDKYKWGVYLNFPQYLGFSFSDKWLIFLSLGTLAFYLMLLIGFTSANKSMQILGFKKWKLIHYFSYISLVIAFIHSMNLGTDIKTSALAPVVHPIMMIMFFGATALLIVRMLNSTTLFEDQNDVFVAAAFFLVLIVGGVFLTSTLMDRQSKIDELSIKLSAFDSEMRVQEDIIINNTSYIQALQKELWSIKNGTVS